MNSEDKKFINEHIANHAEPIPAGKVLKKNNPIDITTSWTIPIVGGFKEYRIYTCTVKKLSIPDSGIRETVVQVTDPYQDQDSVFIGVYGVMGDYEGDDAPTDMKPDELQHLFDRGTIEEAVLTLRRMIGPVRFHTTGNIREWVVL